MTELSRVNLNRLAVFVAVVEAGSLTQAGRRLGLAKTVVSGHIQRLEAEIGAALLVRTTRRLGLTEAGQRFFEACRPLLRELEEAIAAAGQDGPELRGTLRVTAPTDYGSSVVTPVAAALIARHPGLKIDLIAADRILDLVAEGVDVAIRVGWLRDSSQQATRIGTFAQWLVGPAPAAGLASRARQPRDLGALPLVCLSVLRQPASWSFTGPDGTVQRIRFGSALSVTTTAALMAAVQEGAGLGVLPDFAVAREVAEGRLIRFLPDWALPPGEIHAVFPASRHRPRKVRVFLEALRRHIVPDRPTGPRPPVTKTLETRA